MKFKVILNYPLDFRFQQPQKQYSTSPITDDSKSLESEKQITFTGGFLTWAYKKEAREINFLKETQIKQIASLRSERGKI